MKKSLLAIPFALLAIASCNKENGSGPKKLEATLEFAKPSVELVYGESSIIEATAVTDAVLDRIVLQAVKKNGKTYVAVGEAQEFKQEGLEIKAEYFADSKETTDIELTLWSGKSCKAFYLPATVTGEMPGTVWINTAVTLYADNKVAHNVNDPETYPEENTGAGSDTKSFFSMHGVKIGDKVEHILSLNELLQVDGLNASMCWLNVLEKTDAPKVTFIGSHRGYMFSSCKASQLGGGTTGRQCDIANYSGHQIKDENVDLNFSFKVVNGSWAGEKYDEAKYTLVDRIWLSIDESADTELAQMKAFRALRKIQEELDNSKLGVEENPTSLGGLAYLRRWANAGEKATSAPVENLRAGDYIIIRSERKQEAAEGEEAVSKYYYGLIQVLMLPNDLEYFTLKSEKGEWMVLDKEGSYNLFMKPAYFAVKTQCEILK